MNTHGKTFYQLYFSRGFSTGVIKCIFLLLMVTGAVERSRACSPLVVPTVVGQTVGATGLILDFSSNTTYQCNGYLIQVEIACIGSNFSGLGPFFQGAPINKTITPMPYTTQTISFSALCPGKTYQWRAREALPPGTFSSWTQTFTFTTAGVFTPPTLNLSATSTIVCPPQTSTLSATVLNSCGTYSQFTYSWSPSAGLANPTTSNPVASTTANTTYTCIVTGGQLGCWTIQNTIQLSLNPNPPIPGTALAAPANICVGKTTTLNLNNAVGNVQWQSAPSNGGPWTNIGGAVATPYATGPIAGNICYRAMVASCTSTLPSNVICITTNSVPVLGTNVIQTTCTNSVATANFTNPGSSGSPSSVTWAPVPGSIINGSASATYTLVGPVSVTVAFPDGCVSVANFNILPPPPIPSFSLVSAQGTSITCFNPTLNLSAATGYTYGTLNYFWSSPSATYVTASISVVSPGNFTVIATDPVTNCQVTRTLGVGVNTIAPLSSITPTFQNINCTLTSVAEVTAVAQSPTVNITHQIMGPLGGTLSANTPSFLYVSGGPGTYTHCLINNVNGCSTCKQFTVFSNQGFPTFNVVSPQNFSLGCGTKSVANINIVNGATTPLAGGPVSYTLLGPPTSTTTPSGTLSANSTYTVNVPGTWTVITKDNTTFCETKLPISVLQNTVGPTIDTVYIPRNIIDCATPSVTLEGFSSTPNVNYVWSFPGVPGNQSGSSLTVANPTLPPASTLVANFTLTIKDLNNTCTSATIIPIFQNKYTPFAKISAGTSSLTCNTATIVLTNGSSSGIPNGSFFPKPLAVVGSTWTGPTPQVPLTGSSTYTAATVGVYTLTVTDLNNGCQSTTFIPIDDGRDYPVVDIPNKLPDFILDCGATGVRIYPTITSPTNVLSYQWYTAPGASITAPNSMSATVNLAGEYQVLVTNTISGCSEYGIVNVKTGTLQGGFTPSYSEGFAPLEVIFSNEAHSSLNNASITTMWSFGNGSSLTTSSAAFPPTTIYQYPGTYTVSQFVAKGPCYDTIQRIIRVELPSRLEVPNIFTPNGDNVNDIFFLKTTNLTEISMKIYDRWGHKIYELMSDKGNIAWDGTNQLGKEAPDGAYFYVLKAKGTDGKSYDTRGTITLIR